ncbi:hypothetical protein [Streptomyces cadmiisoli]|uniref:hypothetical protein n=1 Tax=Streptomyces cadmiisoli TaxID=2184053 RepID=UPI0013A6D53C|nr:hypothetical protein [Streptomyces cadmiisoli]
MANAIGNRDNDDICYRLEVTGGSLWEILEVLSRANLTEDQAKAYQELQDAVSSARVVR